MSDEEIQVFIDALPGSRHASDLLSAEARMDDLRHLLASEVSKMLSSNPRLLMSLMYRIDVGEPELLACLSTSSPAELTHNLTELIITRQLMKVASHRGRESYE